MDTPATRVERKQMTYETASAHFEGKLCPGTPVQLDKSPMQCSSEHSLHASPSGLPMQLNKQFDLLQPTNSPKQPAQEAVNPG
jgi:hypothetical protein